MKKRIASVILTLAFLLGLGTTAQAVSVDVSESALEDFTSELKYGFIDLDETELDNASFVAADPADAIPEAGILEHDNTGEARAVHNPDLYIKLLIAQPLLLVYDADSGDAVGYYLPKGVYRAITYSANTTGLSQFGNISLTTAQTNQFYMEAVESYLNDPEYAGTEAELYGWYVTSYYQCIAQRPQYTKVRPYCNEYYGKYETTNITSQSVTLKFEYALPFPDFNPTIRCQAGIDGGFYFIYTTGPNAGKLGGAALTASITTNSDAK